MFGACFRTLAISFVSDYFDEFFFVSDYHYFYFSITWWVHFKPVEQPSRKFSRKLNQNLHVEMSIITARRPTRRLEQCPDGVWVVETDDCSEGPQPCPVEFRVLARQLAEVLHSLRRCQTANLST